MVIFILVLILFLTTCAHAIIAYHEWFSLVPMMLISYYWHCVPIVFQPLRFSNMLPHLRDIPYLFHTL
jgi:hypothetical protein